MRRRQGMSDPVDQEIEAIRGVLQALTPLSPKVQVTVLEYVVKRLELGGRLPEVGQSVAESVADLTPGVIKISAAGGTVHIRTLKEEKRPSSANEMAALVAYYLSHVVPQAERKATVNQKDVETYFKIAGFRLPKKIRATLQHAKDAGYLEFVGNGQYKLNAVGYNLVVHSMPRSHSTPAEEKKSRKGPARRMQESTRPRKHRK
jgi:hypothetical protein